MPTCDVTISPETSAASAIITIARQANYTLSLWDTTANTSTVGETIVFDPTSTAFAIITIARSVSRTLTQLDDDFNFVFVGQIIFVQEISVGLHRAFRILDIHRNPALIHDRLDGLPRVFRSRTNNAPVVFRSISGLDHNINTVIMAIVQHNTLANTYTPSVTTNITNEVVSMNRNSTATVTLSNTITYSIA